MSEINVWKCKGCGKDRPNTAHNRRSERCQSCASRKIAQKQAQKYKIQRQKVADEIKSAIKSGLTVAEYSKKCGKSRSRLSIICKEFGINPRPRKQKVCAECEVEFYYSPSTNRKYCSTNCFYASGGARRAGDAAAMATRKYGAKKDANHKEIFDAIRTFTAVHDLSAAGFGVPDGLAWVKDGWQLFDVKNPKTGYGRRGLNKRQKEWASDWRGGPVYLIYTVEEAQAFAKGQLENIKRFPDDE